MDKCRSTCRWNISIHALLAESDQSSLGGRRQANISIHALLAESDQLRIAGNHLSKQFLSTLSLRRATPAPVNAALDSVISIHALLAESDHRRAVSVADPVEFLSTLSLRRATVDVVAEQHNHQNFYPRSPCGERRHALPCPACRCTISIHALLAESDKCRQLGIGYCSISVHALLAESDGALVMCIPRSVSFLSTLSLRRATIVDGQSETGDPISIHALLAESDLSILTLPPFVRISIHALLAESDRLPRSATVKGTYFYPRSPCGERRIRSYQRYFAPDISIHALLAESDGSIGWVAMVPPTISIHALLAESDTIFAVRPYDAPIFLSTLSLRRATMYPSQWRTLASDFYPRSPCGERHRAQQSSQRHHPISIHALLAESDDVSGVQGYRTLISIHALLAESDGHSGKLLPDGILFLSTLSLRRATDDLKVPASVSKISIHALLAESDPHIRSTLPGHPDISIHALLAESDPRRVLKCDNRAIISIHALLAESDLANIYETVNRNRISIHALLAESDWWSVDVPGWILGISIHALLAESDSQWRTLASGM